MGVAGARDILGGTTEFHRQRRFGDQRPGLGAHDVDAEYAIGRGVGQHLGEAVGVADGFRPAVGGEREAA